MGFEYKRGKCRHPVDGLLVVNKEAGPSSNQVLQMIRRLLGRPKAGHAGTLDPGAQGVLLVCLGEGTKLAPYLADLEKEYLGRMRFGEATDTYDDTGKVVTRAPVDQLTEELLRRKMKAFLGVSLQIPPMYSAVKVGGQRLYRLARRGETVARRPREIVVSEFSLLKWDSPTLDFRVRCGGGTYIRSLCHELGRKCGSAGTMISLTRSAVGPFLIEQALTVREIRSVLDSGMEPLPVISPAAALPHLHSLTVSDTEARKVRHGVRVLPPDSLTVSNVAIGQRLKLVCRGGRLIAVVGYEGPGQPMPIHRLFG